MRPLVYRKKARVAAIQYARACWPMSMQQNGYEKERLIEIRHFAVEDHSEGAAWAFYQTLFGKVCALYSRAGYQFYRVRQRIRRAQCKRLGHKFDHLLLDSPVCSRCGRWDLKKESV